MNSVQNLIVDFKKILLPEISGVDEID